MKYLIIVAILLAPTLGLQAQITPKGLNVAALAPDIKAKDQNGKKVGLKQLLKKGPVVVVFYRGQWCPYCNKQLIKLQDSLSLLTAKGASVIAISPEAPENIAKTVTKTKVTFPVLFDNGLKISKSYDVNFEVDTKTIEKYKGYGIEFEKANGKNGANLPVPAVYIIGKDGKINFKYFDTDYSKRISVAEILAQL